MTLVLVPHKADRDRVEVWAAVSGTTHPPGDLALTSSAGPAAIGPSARWTRVEAGAAVPPSTWMQVVELGGLAPGRRYLVRGTVDGDTALCRPGTLPDRLPLAPDPAYVILLGSCFAAFRDKEGKAGDCVAALPEEHRPHLKLLCGDQVYLDNPWYEILPRTRAGLAERFLEKYLATWMPGAGSPGLSRLLAEGSTYFLADDHEFWNNHPNWSPMIATRGAGARDDWADVATKLYAAFQALPGQDLKSTQSFRLGPLEVLLVDTRFGRTTSDAAFMDPAVYTQLLHWLRSGSAPGVLVMAAPLFTTAAGHFATLLEDRRPANYDQYEGLARAILASRRSLLILSGDVHFGRIAAAKNDVASRARLIEIAASPLALVDPSAGGRFERAPKRFPADPPRGMAQSRVDTLQWDAWRGGGPGLARDHFMTLGFHALGRGAAVSVTAWQIAKGKAEPVGSKKFTLQEGA